jgi:hypothetical protein
MTDDKPKSCIHAKTIKADNIVNGVLMEGGDAETAQSLIQIAKELERGAITADSMEAKNIVTGLHFIQDPASATSDDLRKEIAALKADIRKAVSAGEIPDEEDAQELTTALEKTETELAKPDPQGGKVVRWLGNATAILNGSAETAEAAGKLQTQVIKLAPAAAMVYSVAKMLFGV